MCQLQVSWNFVYNIRQLKYISLARNFIYNVYGEILISISSPSLTSKWAYGTYAYLWSCSQITWLMRDL